VLYVNKQEFSASSWRSNQGYTKMHGQPANKMHMLQSLFYLTIALHVSGKIINHLQEHKTPVTTASGNRYTVLLSVVIVKSVPTLPR